MPIPSPRPLASFLLALLAGPGGQEPATTPPEGANRLAGETSPYLLQHARNPVDWYPWGAEAFERARREDRPVFLSIGYSACHWCHVMERESFEDEAIAALLDEHFVCIKVDREERPDVDELYMSSVQLMTGRGGWPLSVFLTPEGEPFFGGTYFPPDDAHGLPGFRRIVEDLARIWREDRASVERASAELLARLREQAAVETAGTTDAAALAKAQAVLGEIFDATWGGFGSAPKFPRTTYLALCLNAWARSGRSGARATHALELATVTLDRMLRGGVYDRLGGGFHRYSVDRRWQVPHFEKMLYDNALLVPILLDAWRATREPRYADAARETCDWILREMTTPEGAFASSQDADSEGVEGRFFVWTPAQVEAALGPKLARRACASWDVTAAGNFEHGASVLWEPRLLTDVAAELDLEPGELVADLSRARARLLEVRAERVRPRTDDKVLAAWNGMAISALARAEQALGERRYGDAARRAAGYVLGTLRTESGRLLATARAGRARLAAGLDDHAYVVQGLLDLYETDFDERWLREALALDAALREHFEDVEGGGFFTTADDAEELLLRVKSPADGVLPAGNGVHALNLLRLAELTGRDELAARARRTLAAFAGAVERSPLAHGALLVALDFASARPLQIVVAGADDAPDARALLAEVRGRFLPASVVARARPGADVELVPLLEGRVAREPRAYVCRDFACKRPAETPEELGRQLDER